MAYVVVGLGNPGAEFDSTRHNAGRMMVSWLHREYSENKKIQAHVGKGSIEGFPTTFLLPDTYMNKSGAAVSHVVKSVKAVKNLVVLYDDLDVPLGTIKVSFDRGSGGHKGVESITRALKTKAFLRIRIGISPQTPKGTLKKPLGAEKVEKHILGKFKPEEVTILKKLSKKVEQVLATWVEEGEEAAMHLGNTR